MNFGDLAFSFGIDLVAGIVGILIVLWIERQRRPQLSMKVGVPGWIEDDDPLKRAPGRWLHVQVHNPGMPRWIAWVYDREPAWSCRGWITFHHLDGQRVFDREMIVRWSETPGPEIVEFPTEKGKVAVLGKNVQYTVDIPPGEYTNLDVVWRFKTESECYGWNNESLLHNWRHPSWRLEKGRYVAKVRVKTGGREFVEGFMISNDVGYEDFRLEPVSNEAKSHLK